MGYFVVKKELNSNKKTSKNIYDDYVLEWNIDVYQKYVKLCKHELE